MSVLIGWEFWSNFYLFGHFWRKKIEPVLGYASNIPQIDFSQMPWLCFKEKTSWATRIYSWIQYIRCTAEKSGNPEKNQIFVKKKSQPQKCLKSKIHVCKVASPYKEELHTRILPYLEPLWSDFFWQWFFTKTSEFYRYFNRVSNSEKIKFKILYFWCLLLLTYPSKVIWEYYQNI